MFRPPSHTFGGHSKSIFSIAFSPVDGALLASGSGDKTIKLWDVRTRRLVHTFKGYLYDVHSMLFSRADADFQGHFDEVHSVAFSPADGALLASAGYDKTIKLWDVRSRRLVHTLDGHSEYVRSVAFSPVDSALLASASVDKTIKLWDVQSRRLVRTFVGHSNQVNSVAFLPTDGALLASASNDKTIKVWDVRSRGLAHTFEGHSSWVDSVAFSPAGSLLASASNDKTIKLWDVRARRLVHTFEVHASWVNSVAFSPAGSLLACASNEGIKLWDVQARRLVQTFEGDSCAVRSVAFSPAGGMLASSSDDRTVKLWPVPHQPPAFFDALARADREAWSSEKTLECLASRVSDIAELKLFYTGAAAACRNDDITVNDRNKMIRGVLESALQTFRFDSEVCTAAALKMVIKKAKADGVLEEEQAVRLGRLAENHDTLTDERFVDMEERVARLQYYFDDLARYTVFLAQYFRVVACRLDDRIESVEAQALDYAERVDKQLPEFKEQHKHYLKRRAALSAMAAAVAVLTMGVGSGIIGTVDDVFRNVFNNVIDFSDTRHVFCALWHGFVGAAAPEEEELARLFPKDKVDIWIHGPLHKAVAEYNIEASQVCAAAMIKMVMLCNDDAARVEASDMRDDDAPRVEVSDKCNDDAPRVEASDMCDDDAPRVEASDKCNDDAPRVEASNVCDDDAPRVEASDQCNDDAPRVEVSDYEATKVAAARPSYPTAEAAFGAIIRELGVGAEATSVPLDDDFVMAFEVCFRVNFDRLGDADLGAFKAELLRGNKNAVTSLVWKRFYTFWQDSCTSVEAYLASLAAS